MRLKAWFLRTLNTGSPVYEKTPSRFFEGMVAGNFKTAADGQRLFYPWNLWGGKGYVLPDAQTEQRMRKLLKMYHQVWLPLAIVVSIIANSYSFYYTLTFIPVFLLIYGIYGVGVRSLTRGLPSSSERLRATESWANSARSYSSVILWFLFIVSALFVISDIWMILLGQVGIGLLGMLFFGFCSLVFGYMLRKRA
jgi:hypothetical protein